MLGQRLGLRPFAAMVIRDQVEENSFDKVAKPATLRIDPVTIATKKTQGEFLRELVGGVGIAQGAKEIAVDGTAVPLHQLLLSCGRRLRWAAFGLAHDRPERGNATQVLARFFLR